MTKPLKHAKRIRTAILVVGIVYTLLALAWIVWPWFAMKFGIWDQDTWQPVGYIATPVLTGPVVNLISGLFAAEADVYLAFTALILGLLLLSQWALLRPGRGLTARLAAHGRPMKAAIFSAAAMAMLLSVGLIALVLEVPDLWAPNMERIERNERGPMILLYSGMAALWILWSLVFYAYWRSGDRYTQLTRMIRALVAGSLLEAVVAVPVHVWVMRQRDCYCLRGTYTTLVFAGTVLLWAFGPGVVLLFLREKYRRERLIHRCDNCDYDLTGNTSGVCPECGTAAGSGATIHANENAPA
jgi:hypothetical protein